MFDFAEATKDMTAAEILNYYRNLYYAEPQVTERGIVANAINDYFKEVASIQIIKDCRNCNRYGKHDEACRICTVTVDRTTGISSDPSLWQPIQKQTKGE
jgi:hypothetical protein